MTSRWPHRTVAVTCAGCGVECQTRANTYKPGRPRWCRHECYAARGRKDTLHRRVVKGYVHVYMPSHTRADHKGYVAEHIAVAQEALGKPLPDGAVVHHVNTNRQDNANRNLVICQDQGYHKLLHFRMRIKAAGGNPNTDRVCSTCQRVLPIVSFHRSRSTIVRECKACIRKRQGFQPWRPGGIGRPPQGVEL